MIRILHLTNHLYGAAGAERQLMLNVKSLDRRLFENYLCCVERPRDLAYEAAELGIPVFSLGASGKPQWPLAIWRLCKLLRSNEIDLIHTSLFDADIIGGIAGRLCRIPVVSTLCNTAEIPERLVDNPGVNRAKLTLSNKFWGLVLRSFHQRSIAISYAVKESAVRTYGISEDKITVIYRSVASTWNGNGTMRELEALKIDLRLDGAYPILLNVARLVPQKGQRYLIQAMPAVLERFPQARLMIAGDGQLKDSIAALCRDLGIEQNVTLLGRRNDILNLLELSDIFVFPSLFEGLGGALIEATSAGKPCVASRVGPVPEVLNEGISGLLVPSQSPDELARAIIYLGANRDVARAMGQRGRQIAADRFDFNKNVRRLAELYQMVICRDEASAISASFDPPPEA